MITFRDNLCKAGSYFKLLDMLLEEFGVKEDEFDAILAVVHHFGDTYAHLLILSLLQTYPTANGLDSEALGRRLCVGCLASSCSS